MSSVVRYQTNRAIATITLDAPEKRNVLSRPLLRQLANHLADASRNPGIRGVVLTGTGSTFCAGADLTPAPDDDDPVVTLGDVLLILWAYPKPTVVRLNGHVRAGGIGLVAAADIVLAPLDASFAFTEVRLGVAPAVISVLCARRMHASALRRYCLTGEIFDAATAAAAGLVTLAVPEGELDITTHEIEDALRLSEPNAVATTKELFRSLPGLGVPDGIAHAERISQRLFESEEAREGIRAFKERRLPAWAVVESEAAARS